MAKTELGKLSKAESYNIYKNNIKLEEYLVSVNNNKHREALSRLRLSCRHPHNHKLLSVLGSFIKHVF